jgi:pyruvate formate lyase activating enzyme
MVFGGKNKIVGKDVSVGEVMNEVMKDSFYYKRSGGGLTLSGGESLLQPDFAVALLRAAKENGINTAIETTGFAKFDVIKKYLQYLDFVLMDIKHMNPEKHKEFCGHTNELVLENAKKIQESGANLTIRVPVIPTFNNTVEEISDIARFAKQLGVKRLHLLPYHRMGEDKYAGLGRNYLLKGIEPMTDEYMRKLYDAAYGIFGEGCQIGG